MDCRSLISLMFFVRLTMRTTAAIDQKMRVSLAQVSFDGRFGEVNDWCIIQMIALIG